MRTGPSLTATGLLSVLLERGILTEPDLISMLGEKRHHPTLNVVEQALVRDSIMTAEAVLALKGELTGLPVLDTDEIEVTAHLPETISARTGALVLSRTPLTVAFVEDTVENLDIVASAIRTRDFEVWLISSPQYQKLRAAAYAGASIKQLPHAPDLPAVLDQGILQRASDVHLKVGIPPRLRIDGAMRALPFQPLTKSWMAEQIDRIVQERHRQDLERKFSTDLAYQFGNARFRVNIGHDIDGQTMVLRKMPSKIPTYNELGIPDAIRRLSHLERGLVIVTGPTGSGKSTTLAAIVDDIITNSARHVITLEDPVEFRFPTDRLSLVNQRELGASFASFPDGLRDALRQDPDVILVGEMRDPTTVKAALTAAETGHLVLGTLHTPSAPGTVSRIVGEMPTEEQEAVRAQLAQMLKGVIAQTLLPRASGSGRVAAYEVLLSTPAVATNLRKVDGINALRQTMQIAVAEGMCTMERSLAKLTVQGVVTRAEAEFRAQNLEEFAQQLQHFNGGNG